MAKKKKDTTKAFSIQGFDMTHYRRTEAYTTAIENLYAKATTEISNAVASGTYDQDKPFAFSDYPRIASYVKQVMSKLASNVQAVISEGSRREWLFACQKNDEFIKSIMDTAKLTKKRLEKMQDRNLDALKSFQTRKVEGLDLSARVWKYTDQYKEQLELGLDVGLGEGRSAQQLARDVKQNLKDPNRLFRRVRDKRGNLHLSKAAKAFHPGTGVYRSSVKNAQRLTRSEINMAYRESDYLRWQQLDFVVGFDVHRSNHEPLCKCDLCAQLVGRYPKTFKFKGWHPQCMCYATPVLMDDDTFDANELGDLKAALRGTTYRHLEAKNAVTDVPDNFKAWVESHKEQQQGWKSVPYFIRDNFVDGNMSLGLKESLTDGIVKTIMQAVEQVKSLGIANVDFGSCTVEQANMILEALHEEYDFFGKGGIPLDGISFTRGTKGTGGSYSPKNNTITIDPDIFNDKADSGKDISEKIAALETQKAKLQSDIDKWTTKLATASSAAAKMLKQDIKYMKSRVSDIEIKIQKYQKDISAGHDKIALTYGNSLTDLKDRVKATIHHEFGHLFDHRYNGGEGYSGKAYNSTYAKTTDGEKFAEWYSQYMMGDKEGIPQELIDAFENKKPVDMFKPLLDAIMPQVEQARTLCKEWGLTAASGAIESGIAQKNIEQVKAGIKQATNEALNMGQELNAWLKQIQPLLPVAKSHGINVDSFAGYVTEATGNHAKWAVNRAKWRQAVTELENAIQASIQSDDDVIEVKAPDWVFKLDKTKATNAERLSTLLDNVEHYYGKESRFQSYIDSSREKIAKGESELMLGYELKLWSKYKQSMSGQAKPCYTSINHLQELKGISSASIPAQWRKMYNDAIQVINEHDFVNKGYESIYAKIEKAYNIYKLASLKEVREIGFDNVSPNMPYNIFTEYKKKIPGMMDTLPSKEFFDSLKDFVPLIALKSGAHYSPAHRYVNISFEKDNIDRMTKSPWFRKGLFYHEFGHAFDHQIGLKSKDDLVEVYNDWKTTVNGGDGEKLKKVVQTKLDEFDAVFYKFRDDARKQYQELKQIGKAEEAERVKKELLAKSEEQETLRMEFHEKLGAFTDCLQAAINGHQFIRPRGHDVKYWTQDKQLAEFIAHCSENYWGGNPIFKEIAPQLYDDMRKIIEKFMAKS